MTEQEKEILEQHKCVIKYRFSDDPEDMVREIEPTWKWIEEYQAYEIMPAFPGKQVILL